MSYKGYRDEESYTLSRKKDHEKHKAHYQEYLKQYYLDHREAIKASSSFNYGSNKILCDDKNILYRRRMKAEVLTHYGKGKLACVWCGFSDLRALSIDHINGGGRLHKREAGIKAGTDMYRWLKKNNYPNGFQTLCFNCQWIKRDEKHEYHNYQERG